MNEPEHPAAEKADGAEKVDETVKSENQAETIAPEGAEKAGTERVDESSAAGPTLHDLLLGVAGRVPDDLVATARTWLAEGRSVDVARAVAFAVVAYSVPLRQADLLLLADVLVENGFQPFNLGQVDVIEYDTAPPYLFSPGPPPGEDDGAAGLEKAAMSALDAGTGVGLWKAWRRTADGSPWPAPRRVWLLEVGPGTDPVAAGERVRSALDRAGEVNPQVEVYLTGADLPLYQILARDAATLVWAREPDRRMRLAPVFDEVDEEGTPSFDPHRPRIADGAEKARLVQYLEQGQLVLVSPTLADDILEPERGPVVPMNFRTDGTWVWTDALTYYLDAHGIGPDPEFIAHLRAGSGSRPAVDGVGLHRALAFLSG